jgi:xanthine dehydrogenase YagS FAD-binding subunit
MNPFEWMNPGGIEHAARAATATVAAAMVSPNGKPSVDAAVMKAGGIDLLDLIKEGLLRPRCLINLREIPGLDRIEPAGGGLRIGPNVTLAQLAAHDQVRARFSALADAAGASASPQIRHLATIGGNLLQRPRCWYFRSRAHHCARKGGDACFAFTGENQYHAIFDHTGCAIVHPSTSATALVAFGARLEITDPTGAQREVRLEDFFLLPEVDLHRENDLQPGEIITAIVLASQPPTARSIHIKFSETESFDWPIAEVAVVLDLANGACRKAAVVLGAAAPVPHRARAAEAALTGKRIDEATIRTAAHAALQGAMPLTKNAYKLPIFETLVRRAILAAVETE